MRVKDVRLFMMRNFLLRTFCSSLISYANISFINNMLCYLTLALLSSYFTSFNIMAELQWMYALSPFYCACHSATAAAIIHARAYTFEAWNLLIYLPNLIIKQQRLMFRQDDAHAQTYIRNLICITMMISWRHGITLDFIEVMRDSNFCHVYWEASSVFFLWVSQKFKISMMVILKSFISRSFAPKIALFLSLSTKTRASETKKNPQVRF